MTWWGGGRNWYKGKDNLLLFIYDFQYHFNLFALSMCCCCCLVTKSYPTLCDPMGCSMPGICSNACPLSW